MKAPEFADVLEARRRIKPYLAPTPTRSYPGLDALVGTDLFVKHENHQPTGAFKVRGGINLVSRLSADERRRGVITVSTGNHGQSVVYAARLFDVKARVVVPKGANPGKVASMRGMGGEVVFHGEVFDQARLHCESLAGEHGYRLIHPGNEPLLIAGVATETLEMLEDRPDLQVLIVPVGGGSGAAGACIVARTVKPGLKIIAVQSQNSPAAFRSWKGRRSVSAPDHTLAEGLATGTAFALTQKIMRKYLDEFILVSDEEILRAMVWMAEYAHTLAEAAGAASLAAAYKLRRRLKGKKTGIICSGGNTSLIHLKLALENRSRLDRSG